MFNSTLLQVRTTLLLGFCTLLPYTTNVSAEIPLSIFQNGFEDLNCPNPIEPYEVCGDCRDNDCDGITEADSLCVGREILAIQTDQSGVSTGHSIRLTFDHQQWVTAGLSTAPGEDIRIYYRNPITSVMQEIDRVLDPESEFNSSNTTIWFAAQQAFVADQVMGDPPNTDYYIYFGVVSPPTPAADEAHVFQFADFFDRAISSTVGGAWTETEAAGATVGIEGEALEFSVLSNDNQRPAVWATFPPMNSELWILRMHWNWLRTGDSTFALYTQLGSTADGLSAAPTATNFYPTSGVGPSLVWARGIWGFASSGGGDLGTTNGVTSNVIVDEFTGAGQIAVKIDVEGKSFAINPNGDLVNFSSPIGFLDSSISSVDAIRIVSQEQDGTQFPSRRFDYVILSQAVPDGELEPTVAFAPPPEPGPGCSNP